MLKTILFIAAVLVVLAVIYVGWVISKATRDIEKRVTATASVADSGISVEVILTGTDRAHQVTEITFPRAWGEIIGISGPADYLEQPYLPGKKDDPEAAEWRVDANKRLIRWVGSRELTPNETTVFEFPIIDQIKGTGSIEFIYETKIGVSGSLSSFGSRIEIGDN